jgi:hypothetical protein
VVVRTVHLVPPLRCGVVSCGPFPASRLVHLLITCLISSFTTHKNYYMAGRAMYPSDSYSLLSRVVHGGEVNISP